MEFAELAGTIVFAISGVIAVAGQRLDWFGIVVVGIVTAVGGGTMRDLILGNTPVFWIQHEIYLVFAFLGSIAAIPIVLRLAGSAAGFEKSLKLADALGLALFAIVGASLTLELGFDGTTAVICGVLTGVGGGVVRDLLAGQTPLIMRGDVYATAALAGATAFVLLYEIAAFPLWLSSIAGMVLVFSLRMVALNRGWSLPKLR